MLTIVAQQLGELKHREKMLYFTIYFSIHRKLI